MQSLKITSPYDGSVLHELPLIDPPTADDYLTRAHACYADRDQWLTVEQRYTILQNTLDLLKQRKPELALTATSEGGKPLADSLIEVDRAILGVRSALEYISQLTGREIPMRLGASSAKRIAYTYREPGGVVLAISAFNHPINLIIHQVIPAIAAGCPVLIKPASKTPLSCLQLMDILYTAGLPTAWAQMLLCSNQVAARLVADPRINFFSFIGSAEVGWALRSKLAPGVQCSLEHGGAAPVIIEADADLDHALPLLTKGGFYHAGQVCVSVQRVFVQQKIAKKVAQQLAELADAQIVGDPQHSKTQVGPLISPQEVDRIDEWVRQAVAGGAELLAGGKKISATCYAPTVLLNPPADAKVSTTEIFGPVICVYAYADRLKAIEQANRLPFCFQAAVFTQNIDSAVDSVKRLKATTVMINDSTTFRVDWMPFGGRQHSGMGLGGIAYAMREMTYEKMFVLHSASL